MRRDSESRLDRGLITGMPNYHSNSAYSSKSNRSRIYIALAGLTCVVVFLWSTSASSAPVLTKSKDSVTKSLKSVANQFGFTGISELNQYKPYDGAPGFEEAVPSCNVVDLPNDPLVKEYGQTNIRLSRSYEGSGARIRKMLQKAINGQGIKMAVVGGSGKQ